MSVRQKQKLLFAMAKGMTAGEAGKIWKRLYHG